MNHCELQNFNKSVSRRNLLLSNTPPGSPNFHQIIKTEDDNNESSSNIDNEDEENNNDNNEDIGVEKFNIFKKIKTMYNNRQQSNYARIPLHLLLHIALLSIFEILLFFNFVVVMEKNAFFDKLKEYLKNDNFIEINPVLVPLINTELSSNQSMEWYETLKYKNDKSIDDYYKYNNQLQVYSWHGTVFLGLLFISYILFTFMIYKLSLKKLILKHIILISLIGVYEYWFFINIILPYKIISANELNYVVTSCILKKLNDNIDGININSTITDACTL